MYTNYLRNGGMMMKLKKLIAGVIITASALMFSAVPNHNSKILGFRTEKVYADTEYTSGLWGYEKYSDGTVGITGYSGFEENLTIPSKLDGYVVTGISDRAFQGNYNINVVNIPSSIYYIGFKAFAGSSLTKITIPETVTVWGTNGEDNESDLKGDGEYVSMAFAYCYNLQSVTVNAESLERAMFYECDSLTNVTLGSKITYIPDETFCEATSLSNIKINANLYSIGDYAFYNCKSLKSVNLGNKLKNIGIMAFAGSGLTSITIPSTVDYWSMDINRITYLPSGKTIFEDCSAAFAECDNLVKVSIDSYTVPEYAFYSCKNLKSVKLGKTVKYINDGAFYNAQSLCNVEVKSHLKRIGSRAFWECISLKTICLGNELESMGIMAFAGSGLEKIIIPNTIIDWESCRYDAELPNGGKIVQSNGAFAQCYDLSTVIMGDMLLYYNFDIFKNSYNVNIHCIRNYGTEYWAEREGYNYTIYSEGIPVKSIRSQHSNYTVVVGEEIQLYPIVEPQNTTDKIWWTSGNEDIVYIDRNGKLRAFSTGTVAVKGESSSGKVCTFIVNVVSSGTTTYDTEPTKNITLAKIDGLGNKAYTGSTITPNVSVLFNPCTELIPDVDYTISYTNNKNVGTATVKVVGKGKYTGTITKTFKILPATVSSLKQNTSYSTTSITMSWKKLSNVTGYEVYRATSANGKYTKVKTTTSTTYKQGKLTRGKTYYYKVRAYKTVNGSNIYGNYSSVKAMGTKPQTPSIKLYAGNKKAKVVWKKISGISGYEIYMSTSKNGTYQKVKTSGAKNTAYLKTGLIKGKVYYFKLRSYRTVGGKKIYSSWSSVKAIKVK